MADPRCPACASLLRWTGIRYYCTKCKSFPYPLAHGVRVLDEAQPVAWRTPVAWMTEAACSSPVVTDDFLKQYPQWRSTYTIPLYRSAPGVKVDAPPADQLREMWQAAMARAYSEDEGEAYEFFARALLAAAGVTPCGEGQQP